MHLTKEKKVANFKQYGKKANNTGSIEGQIANLSERIVMITAHLGVAKKDFATHRGLMKLVGQRKRLLTYLHKSNLTSYRALIEKLGLRK
ncbi:MAG: 30S ribosomal protein S15 [Phycisphaerales bacterium]|nr:30S ribosomal protein S15 [Phycisphaerales bacterium]